MPCLLIVSPHADDEVLGAPGLVLAAGEAGWRVVNLLCFLRPSERRRRLAEVSGATAQLRIELRLASEPLLSLSVGEHPVRARELLTTEIDALTSELTPRILLSPSPHDMHPAHEAVADGTRLALQTAASPPRWIMWGWWGELPVASTVASYGAETLGQAQQALAEHAGELDRLDLSTALDARARWNAAMGPERVMGPGHRTGAQPVQPFADLLLETRRHRARWPMAAPRVIDAGQALEEPDWSERDLTPWLDAPSASRLVPGPPGSL